MNKTTLLPVIHAGNGRTLSRAAFMSLIKTYNCFLKDQTQLHLTYFQDSNGQVTVEGFLNISWGVTRPIRLQIQDDKQTVPISPVVAPEPISPISPLGSKRGMTRWGEYSDLHQIDEINAETQDTVVNKTPPAPVPYETTTLRPMRQRNPELEAESNLFRCMSDASLVKRRRGKTAEQREKERQHRFSINGHFYNYKTSIFTPSYGTSTKVRITTRMTTNEVIEQLLHKFKIENIPQEFALYCVHQSGEKRKLSIRDQPLWERILQGPSEDIMKIFLMDREEEEVSNDVAQYLNLELPILEQVLLKLREEEVKEVQRVISKYHHQHIVLSHVLSSKLSPHIETSV